MQQQVGYKLIEIETGNEIASWGGTWGICPGIPNPLSLPNNNGEVCGATIEQNYNGYKLIPWMMDEPPPADPESVTPRQVRLLLLSQNLLDQVEAMIQQQDRATQITWEFAIEFKRTDPLLQALAGNIGLSQEQLDQFFIAASQL